MSVKRLNYFTHQFLREQDFKDEQNYHLEMRRRHNRLFHAWGVVDGLEVHKKDDLQITIEPGMAVDRDGREIVLAEPIDREVGSFGRDSRTYITIAFGESWDEGDHQNTGGVDGYTRITEHPQIGENKQRPQDGTVLSLACVHLNDLGHIDHIEMDPLARKLAVVPNPAAGWVRLPFKPVRLSPIRMDRSLVRVVSESEATEYDFTVDEFSAYCWDKGRGSMGIPVPPTAKAVVGFRIAGTTQGTVEVHLFRGGWNREENKGERYEVLKERLTGPTFHKDFHLEVSLNESHSLAVAVIAEGDSAIWLVAAKFE